MQFSIGDVFALADKTILNPFLTVLVPAYLHFFTENKFVITTSNGWLPYALQRPFPRYLYKSLVVVGLGLALRVNRYLNKRALNNGVTAKFDWNHEIIVVTGAAGGIGAATAQKLAARGSKVVVIDVMPLTFSKPKNIYYYKCDITNFQALQTTAGLIEKEVGQPTCVVANAGICRGKPLLDATQRDIELTLGVNNLGLIWTAKTFLPSMVKKDHGHFIVIASQTGFLATAGIVDYGASKSAALAIYEGLHTELKHMYKAPSVRMSCISPSAVNTKMFDGIKGDSNFILPRLSPEDLGDVIAGILWKGESQNIMVPAFAYISIVSKILPEWLRVAMQDGGSGIMTELKPHNPMA